MHLKFQKNYILYIINIKECINHYYIVKQTITIQYVLVCTIVIMYMECPCSKIFVKYITHWMTNIIYK